MPQGKVYLVGAGPGDPAYLTVQAQSLLAQAEVVVYDALVDDRLLALAPKHCLCLNVGKRGGQPSLDQAAIDRLLVEQCQQGKQVVRLKSGDPFVFGRCRSEIEALQDAECSFAVIPGLSSALAAPLLAGIPLTDPGLSQGFMVCSAHNPVALNWQTLAQVDTLVLLMGGRHLATIVAQLQHQGRSPQTPVAVVRWGGHPHQQVWRGTLSDISQKTVGVALSPAVIVVGPVAQLHLQSSMHPDAVTLASSNTPNGAFFAGPLAGKIILVTRAAGQSSPFSDRLQEAGARVIEMPALEIVPPSSWAALDAAIARLNHYDWLILTSANGVDYFFERLADQGRDTRALAGIQIAVVGEKTAASLSQRGLKPDFIPPDFVADALVTHFPQAGAGLKILFPRVETGGRDALVAGLSAKGAAVTEVPAYQSCCPETIAPEALEALSDRAVDVITFASAKTVQNFRHLLEQAVAVGRAAPPLNHWQIYLEGVCLASIGPQTSKACRTKLGRVDLEAAEYTLEGLTQAIVNHYNP